MTRKRTLKRPATTKTTSNGTTEKISALPEKRKKQSVSSGSSKPANGSSLVVDKNGCGSMHVPQFVKDFFSLAKKLCSSDPCSSFKKLASCRLVGVFDVLNGSLNTVDENQLFLHYRYATDLPEMQTVLVCEMGRYCLWRDIPNSEEGWIVYVPNDEHFPKIELVGNRIEHAIVHLSEKSNVDAAELLAELGDVKAIKQQMKSACALRKKKKLGNAPNGAGLWVQVVNDVGYRPISEDAAKIRKTLDLICNTDDDSLREKKMQWLMEIVTLVQFANDECDFGMGLELGHWVFLANHPSLDKIAYRILSTAYTLLQRSEYKKILDVQMAPGIRRRKELDVRTNNAVF